MASEVRLPDGSTVPAPANVIVTCAPSKDKILRPGQFMVNDLEKMEAITQPLYSYQAYAAAGQNSLVFFQTPVSGTITGEDTNMQLAGQLPAPQKFLVQGIGVDYLPGTAAGLSAVAPAANSQLNDMQAIMRRGRLTFQIGSKNYLEMTTLQSLPPRSHIDGVAAQALATTVAAATPFTQQSLGFVTGPVFKPNPLLLEASQNFKITLDWPGGVVAIPSADANARIGVWLYGTLYRSPQ